MNKEKREMKRATIALIVYIALAHIYGIVLATVLLFFWTMILSR